MLNTAVAGSWSSLLDGRAFDPRRIPKGGMPSVAKSIQKINKIK